MTTTAAGDVKLRLSQMLLARFFHHHWDIDLQEAQDILNQAPWVRCQVLCNLTEARLIFYNRKEEL